MATWWVPPLALGSQRADSTCFNAAAWGKAVAVGWVWPQVPADNGGHINGCENLANVGYVDMCLQTGRPAGVITPGVSLPVKASL